MTEDDEPQELADYNEAMRVVRELRAEIERLKTESEAFRGKLSATHGGSADTKKARRPKPTGESR